MEYIGRGSHAKPLVVGLTMPSQEVGTARDTIPPPHKTYPHGCSRRGKEKTRFAR